MIQLCYVIILCTYEVGTYNNADKYYSEKKLSKK